MVHAFRRFQFPRLGRKTERILRQGSIAVELKCRAKAQQLFQKLAVQGDSLLTALLPVRPFGLHTTLGPLMTWCSFDDTKFVHFTGPKL
jgi:hypothetical protein